MGLEQQKLIFMKNLNNLKIRLSSILVLLAIIGWSSSSFAQWQTSGSDIYFDGGNVGIETTSPVRTLHLGGIGNEDTGGPVIKLGTDIAGRNFEIVGNTGGPAIGFKQDNAATGDYLLTIRSAGDVGIGTASPSEKLEVVGKIKSSGPNSALILTSPDGTTWAITIDNSGTLSAAQSTKVLEIENENDVIIFPNPTENKVTIDLKANGNQNISTELFDITGKIVYIKSYKTNSIILDLNDFESGTYILKIKNSSGEIIKTEKIVKK